MASDLSDIEYLKCGSDAQRDAHRALVALEIFRTLSRYTPVLAGTLPLGISTAASDLDIICQARDLKEFLSFVTALYGDQKHFEGKIYSVRSEPAAVIRFRAEGFDFELFCQNTPVAEQWAVLHLMVERRLLLIGGGEARMRIQALKESGLKTEPAFAKHFGLSGDPYEELARLARVSEKELLKLLKR